MYENNGSWCFKDSANMEWVTQATSTMTPKEATKSVSERVKNAIKLRGEGFKPKDIIAIIGEIE